MMTKQASLLREVDDQAAKPEPAGDPRARVQRYALAAGQPGDHASRIRCPWIRRLKSCWPMASWSATSKENRAMAKKTFEQSLKQLEADRAPSWNPATCPSNRRIKKFEEGMELSRFCSQKLEETERKITLLMQDSTGQSSKSRSLPRSR
ncbi:MAG: exodeoxyribonuclease VII small subunit [Desulfobacterales bacterium]|nr:exodeoxyribonuclease VII small subunit [Desulfobacterales bacterium]